MTDTVTKKYLFDTDFGTEDRMPAPVVTTRAGEAKTDGEKEGETSAPEDAPQPEEAEIVEEVPAPPTYSEEDLMQAREEAMQAGRDEATRDLTSAMEQRLINTLDAINSQVETLFDAYARDNEEHSRHAVGVAAAIVHKLFPAMNMDKALDEVEHMIVEAMKRTSGAPSLVIHVPQELQQEVETKANELAALRGREGTITVMTDANMALGDVTVEWGGGGMTRDTRFIWQEIDEIIERNLGQKLEAYGAPTPETPTQSEQEVVNPAQVGKNEENSAESPQTDGDTPQHDAESEN